MNKHDDVIAVADTKALQAFETFQQRVDAFNNEMSEAPPKKQTRIASKFENKLSELEATLEQSLDATATSVDVALQKEAKADLERALQSSASFEKELAKKYANHLKLVERNGRYLEKRKRRHEHQEAKQPQRAQRKPAKTKDAL